MSPSIELITEASKVWTKLRRGEITREQLEAELREIETAHGMRPTGDEIDRGWEDHRDFCDTREQVGGTGL